MSKMSNNHSGDDIKKQDNHVVSMKICRTSHTLLISFLIFETLDMRCTNLCARVQVVTLHRYKQSMHS